MNTLHVEDFVVFGRTVPEESKKYGKKVCMAGYSAQCNQLLRVYPLLVPIKENAGTNEFKARYTYIVDLIRNPEDSRTESWRVVNEKQPTATPWNDAKEVKKDKIIEWLSKRVVPSIKCLNQCKLSLGVMYLKAGEWEGISVAREEPDPEPEHATLFDDLENQVAEYKNVKPPFDPAKVKFAPYIRFKDEAGNHRLQVREWGAFLLMAKPEYCDNPDALWNANGYKRNRDTVIVVGNMTNHRNNWLIIKLFQPDVGKEPSLFDNEPDEAKPAGPAKQAKK